MLDAVGEGNLICGEIYSVDQEGLDSLDILEGVPKHYQRRREDIIIQDCLVSTRAETNHFKPGTVVNCWLYVCNFGTDGF